MDSESNCGNTICFSVFDQDPKGNIDISVRKWFRFYKLHGVGKNKSILLNYYSRRRQNYIIGIQEINNFFSPLIQLCFIHFFLPIKNEKSDTLRLPLAIDVGWIWLLGRAHPNHSSWQALTKRHLHFFRKKKGWLKWWMINKK